LLKTRIIATSGLNKEGNVKLLDKLIEQSKLPSGFIGKVMIRIMNRTHDRRTRWAINKLKISKASTILDVGCGGNTIRLLSQLASNGKICGIDYSKESIEITSKLNKKLVNKGLVEISHASVENIPYPTETFNIVTMIQTHYHLHDLEKSIHEVYRVTNQNGTFMIASELYKINYHMSKYKTNEQLKDLFVSVGFINIKIYETSGWLCIIGNKL